MRALIGHGGLAVLMAWFLVGLSARAQDKVEVKVVKYTGLADAIRQLKGKVAVVDFWADS
jgi:hypothetical protein